MCSREREGEGEREGERGEQKESNCARELYFDGEATKRGKYAAVGQTKTITKRQFRVDWVWREKGNKLPERRPNSAGQISRLGFSNDCFKRARLKPRSSKILSSHKNTPNAEKPV